MIRDSSNKRREGKRFDNSSRTSDHEEKLINKSKVLYLIKLAKKENVSQFCNDLVAWKRDFKRKIDTINRLKEYIDEGIPGQEEKLITFLESINSMLTNEERQQF